MPGGSLVGESGVPESGDPESGDPESQEFWDRYEEAASAIVEFLGADGLSLKGRRVADIGSGNGVIDLGLAHKAQPEELVGFDIHRTNESALLEMAAREGVATALPSCLRFEQSTVRELPTADASFDFVVTWSAFEHVADPGALARELRRVIKPDGVLFLQLWPFYYSEHGSHLWEWFPGGFAPLLLDDDEISARVRGEERGGGPSRGEYMLSEYATLNRLTLDELQQALRRGHFAVTKIELITNATHLPVELADYPLSSLAVGGVKLLAVPR